MADYFLKPMNPKGEALLDVCHRKQFVLASGCRLSTKTINALMIVCHHAWNTNLANIALVTITQTAGVDSGVWQQLTEMVIPTFGLKYKRAPYLQGSSKKPCCIVVNKFGQGVKITLESLKIEDEAEMRFKSKTYSMIFVTELDNFKKLKTFLTWTECLRMPHLKDNEHLFLADCNPSDEGTSSWIYKLWFEHGGDDENLSSLQSFIGQLGLVEFDLNDNIYSTANRIQQVKDKYSLDPDLYKRYVLGQWVTATENALFARVFKEHLHVVGEPETRSNPTPELLLPESTCIELGGGWDLGVVNSAFVIIEKFIRDEWFVREVNGKSERVLRSVPYFKWLDELVLVDEDFLMEDFVMEAMKKMRFWEDFIGRPVQWTHWSDRSAFDMSEPLGGRYQHQLVAESSGGKIRLMAAMEGRRNNETVRQRIDLFRKLLFQGRTFFSAAKTPRAIEMCKGLKKGRGAFSTIQKDSKHKHVFDAGTYYIATECFEELNRNLLMGWEREHQPSGVVAVGM